MDDRLDGVASEHPVQGLVIAYIQLVRGDRAASQPADRVECPGELFEKLSTTTTSCPRPSSSRQVWLPMKPAPPVTSTTAIDRLLLSYG